MPRDTPREYESHAKHVLVGSNVNSTNGLKLIRTIAVLWAPIAVAFGLFKIVIDYHDLPDVILGLSSAITGIGLFVSHKSNTSDLGMSTKRRYMILFASVLLFGAVALTLGVFDIAAIFFGYTVGLLFTFAVCWESTSN